LELATPDDRFDARVDEFDENFTEYEPEEPTTGKNAEWAADEPPTANPFDEMFDDEEIVIDPFASLSAVVSGGGAPVRNTFEKEISGLLNQVAQYDAPSPVRSAPMEKAKEVEVEKEIEAAASPTAKIGKYDELSNSFTIVEAFEGGRSSSFAPGRDAKTASGEQAREKSSGASSSPLFRYGSGDEEKRVEEQPHSSSEVLVVDDDAPAGESPSIAFPTDYRQLFASLRRD